MRRTHSNVSSASASSAACASATSPAGSWVLSDSLEFGDASLINLLSRPPVVVSSDTATAAVSVSTGDSSDLRAREIYLRERDTKRKALDAFHGKTKKAKRDSDGDGDGDGDEDDNSGEDENEDDEEDDNSDVEADNNLRGKRSRGKKYSAKDDSDTDDDDE